MFFSPQKHVYPEKVHHNVVFLDILQWSSRTLSLKIVIKLLALASPTGVDELSKIDLYTTIFSSYNKKNTSLQKISIQMA